MVIDDIVTTERHREKEPWEKSDVHRESMLMYLKKKDVWKENIT